MKKIIIVRIWEGIGNQLFQYAYAKSLQAKGYEVFLDLSKSYDDTFEKYRHNDTRVNSIQNYRLSISEIDIEKYKKYNYLKRDSLKNKIIFWMATHGLWKYKFWEEKLQCFQKKSANIKPSCYVKGWFQSERYFKHIAQEIRKDISLKNISIVPAELRACIDDPQSISIHVRRGDYVKLHHELNSAYFIQAIAYLRTKYSNPQLIVFSDDVDWVKDNMDLTGKVYFVEKSLGLKDYEEVILMSQCCAHIISNSTFGWWGAWLDNKENKDVVAPRQWLKGQEGIIPEEWHVI